MFLGAGGSARACVYAAIQGNASEITVANRTIDKAKKLVQSIKSDKTKLEYIGIGKDELTEVSATTDIIVNTTTISFACSIRVVNTNSITIDTFITNRI